MSNNIKRWKENLQQNDWQKSRQREQEYKVKSKEAHEMFRGGGRGLFKSKLEQMELFIITLKQRNFIKKWIV
jgi:hypothetical protein